MGTRAEWLTSLAGNSGEPGLSAYQAAVAGGFIGTEAAWLASLAGEPGPAGDNAEIVVLTLAAYLALSPATQMDGRWYVVPTTS